jgi:hypothetical protein
VLNTVPAAETTLSRFALPPAPVGGPNTSAGATTSVASGRPTSPPAQPTTTTSSSGLPAAAPTSVVDERAVREEFVDVVAQDVVRDKKVYALPTSVDTLALYYNKDILNAGRVPKPPETWTQVQQMVESLTRVNRSGAIDQSAAALGTASNINRGMDILQATLEAVQLRLRPILMTSLAFILGVAPLAFASGAGAEARSTIGWTVLGGMMVATIFGIFIIPVLFVIITKIAFRKRKVSTINITD